MFTYLVGIHKFMGSELAIKFIVFIDTEFTIKYLHIFDGFRNTNTKSKQKLLGSSKYVIVIHRLYSL